MQSGHMYLNLIIILKFEFGRLRRHRFPFAQLVPKILQQTYAQRTHHKRRRLRDALEF